MISLQLKCDTFPYWDDDLKLRMLLFGNSIGGYVSRALENLSFWVACINVGIP